MPKLSTKPTPPDPLGNGQPAAPAGRTVADALREAFEQMRRGQGQPRTHFRSVSRQIPCPVCQADHKCSLGDDGAILCGRRSGPVPGFRCLGPCAADPTWTIYRKADGPVPDWPALAEQLAGNLTPDRRDALAKALGLPANALEALDIGYLTKERAYTFPERDHRGEVIGLLRRYPGGCKKAMRGGSRGLAMPAGWRDRPGPVYIAEGPSDTATLSAMGLAAVGRPSCSGGGPLLARLLAQDAGRPVIVLGENDRKPDGTWPSRQGAIRVAEELARRLNRPVAWALPPDREKDVRAWTQAKGLGPAAGAIAWERTGKEWARLLDRGKQTVEPPTHADTFSAAELLAMDIAEPVCVVEGLVPEGLSLLVGRPKLGKSWLALLIAIAIALGLPALGNLAVLPGDVLFLALEDSRRRLRSRLAKLLAGAEPPERLTLATAWPRTDDGALVQMERWVGSVPDPKLIVVDTLARIRKNTTQQSDRYGQDYADLAEIKALADRYGVGILAVHHVRKAPGADPLDEVSGTTGITAAADTILILRRQRGQADAYLNVTGRDVDEHEYAMGWDAAACRWSILGPAEEHRAESETDHAIKVLAEQGKPMTPSQLAPLLGKNAGATKLLLWRASQEGKIKTDGKGSYFVEKPRNRSNPVTVST